MSPHVKSSSILAVALLLGFGLLVCPNSLSGQVIKVEAGASDILPSQGGSIHIQGENYEGYVGAGDIGGVFRFGSYLKTSFDGYKFTLGDQSTMIGLPTDIFGSQQYFITRGAGVSGQVHGAKVFLFGGATALGIGSQFFQAAQAQVPVGMLFVDIPISDKLAFYSRNIASYQQTSIQGLNWRPFAWLNTGLSAGIGGNKPYMATTLEMKHDWLDLKAGYIVAGNQFRRITTPSIFAAEHDRENLQVTIKPVSGLAVIASHENLLQPQTDFNAPFLRATVDQFQADYNVAKFRLGAGLFESHSRTFHNLGEDFSVYRPITRNIEAGVNYFRTLSGPRPRSSNLSGSIREKITQKLSLLQVVTSSQGNTNVLFGGSYTANRFAVNVDYQNLYLPFLPNNPFSQSLTVSLRIKLFGNVQVNGDTFRSSDGKLRYSAGASTLLVHNFQHGSSSETFNFPKYVVRGHVRDRGGAPIEGAAIRIGGELVYTNAFGEFLLRQKKPGPLALEVVLEEFTNTLRFRVIAAPPTVTAEPEDSAPDVQIVLEPVFRSRATLGLLPKALPAAPRDSTSANVPSTPPPHEAKAPSAPPTPLLHEAKGVNNPLLPLSEVKGASGPSIPLPLDAKGVGNPPTPPPHEAKGVNNPSLPPSEVKGASGPSIPLPLDAKGVGNPPTPPPPHEARGEGESPGAISKVPKYVIRGHVRDEHGAPIEGAALLIGTEVVFTNAEGEFLSRQKRAGLFSFSVASDQFANPLQFKVVEAPQSVTANPENSAHDVVAVLAHVLPGKQL